MRLSCGPLSLGLRCGAYSRLECQTTADRRTGLPGRLSRPGFSVQGNYMLCR